MTTIRCTVYLAKKGEPNVVISDVLKEFDYDVKAWYSTHVLETDERGEPISFVANVGTPVEVTYVPKADSNPGSGIARL